MPNEHKLDSAHVNVKDIISSLTASKMKLSALLESDEPLITARSEELQEASDYLKRLLYSLDEIKEEMSIVNHDAELKATYAVDLPHISIIIGHNKRRSGAFSKTLNKAEYFFWVNQEGIANINRDTKIYPFGTKSRFTYSVHDRNEGLRRAYLEADKFNPMFTMELHFNSSASSKAHGAEVLALSNAGTEIATLYQAKYAKNTNECFSNRGVRHLRKGQRGAYNLSLSKHPSILIEPFFGSSESDCAKVTAYGMKNFFYTYVLTSIQTVVKVLQEG